jgi:hypothetical protein
MRTLFTAIALTLALLLPVTATSADQIQARLVRGTHKEQPANPKLDDIRKELTKKFGFPHYAIIGQASKPLNGDKQQRLDLGEGFVVLVTDKTTKANAKKRTLDVEWYSGMTPLVKFTAEIALKGTVLVKGPEVGRDWLILSLSLQK